MGKFIDDRFEAEFTVEAPLEEVWESLQLEGDRELAWLSAFPRFAAERTGEVLEQDAPNRVRVLKTSEPCKGTEIAVSLESVESGTRVLVVQSGFPAFVKASLESFEIGGNQIIADLALFLNRGVTISRHSMPWAFAGVTTREVDTGLEVTAVIPGCFGERVGLQAGDLLMTFNGAPVFTQACLQALLRVFRSGEEVSAAWVRGRGLQEGVASL